MVSTQRSSQVPPTTKKQQSISTFFAKVPSSPAAPVRAAESEIQPSAEDQENHASLFLEDDESPNSNDRFRAATPKRTIEEVIGDGSPGQQAQLPSRKKSRLSDETHEDRSDGILSSPSALGTLDSTTLTGVRRPKVSDRTAKYLYSSSPAQDEENVNCPDEEGRKARLHEKFVKKLGRPDSIAEIKRRNWQVTEETEALDEAEDEGEDEEEAPKPVGRRAPTMKKGGSKLTPMEKQVLDIKREHPDTVLVVEVGYKFRFFGEDARTAAKELSIVCIPGKMRYDEHPSEAHLDRFASASIPVHRLHVHVKRLVAAGHKVGVVRQLETAALKAAGDNRNAPFTRKLTNLYTKGTYIDDIEGLEGAVDRPVGGASATGYLLCLTENKAKGWGTDEKVQVGIVAVQPCTGDVIYDEFEDGFMRSEIETRLLHIAPCELLIVGELSKATEKLVQHLSGSKTNVFGDKIRVERIDRPKNMAATSYSHVSNFYAGKMNEGDDRNDITAALLEKVLKLSENVTMCLSAMITHMTDYKLEHVFDLTKYFQSFSARSHMLLNGTTLTSLEIYQNQTDHSEKGSLFWTLDRTTTRFGNRLLRKWVGRPLLDKAKLEERVAAVEELKDGQHTVSIDKLNFVRCKIKSDLEKSLIRIYYGKCTRPELLTILQTLQRISAEFVHVKSPSDAGFKSAMINVAIASLPTIAEDVVEYLEKINPEAARKDDKYSFFREEHETSAIEEHKLGIAAVEDDLNEHRAAAAEKVRKKKVEYVTVAGIEYLIEIENTWLKHVPASWVKISGTKKVSRFHTPEVTKFIRMRDQHRESLAAACEKAYADLLKDISSKYQLFRDAIQALATLDCLLSLAAVASQPGYVRPEYADSTCIEVVQGRHPMVEQLLLDNYVPNDIALSGDGTRALLVTGPNMGGKSSYVRQVALIAIMAQIGSYVPAESARLGMLDAVFTRMGAFDNMMAGESTFMVELSETSDILKQASSRSLIILDELGRGTSTHDGVAIAQAVLDHVVRETKALTLFITHYQNLAIMANNFQSEELKNVHMRFTESGDSGQDITFLYEVGEGVAHRSYGLNVARLASIPEDVLQVAAVKSKELEEEALSRKVKSLARGLSNLMVGDMDGNGLETWTAAVELL